MRFQPFRKSEVYGNSPSDGYHLLEFLFCFLSRVCVFCSAFRCCYCYHLNPARKQRPIAPKLDYDTWTTPRHISGHGAGVRHRKPTNSVQAMLEKKTGQYWILSSLVHICCCLNMFMVWTFSKCHCFPEWAITNHDKRTCPRWRWSWIIRDATIREKQIFFSNSGNFA